MQTRYATTTTDDGSVKELISEATRELGQLVRKEVELAKTEVKGEASRAAKAGAMFAAMGVIGFVAFVLLSFGAAWGLAEGIPTALAFLAVGLLYAVIAGLLFVQGRRRMKDVKPPRATLQTVKQDVQVAKAAFSAGAGNGGHPGETPSHWTGR